MRKSEKFLDQNIYLRILNCINSDGFDDHVFELFISSDVNYSFKDRTLKQSGIR